jgi:hypothetical protein
MVHMSVLDNETRMKITRGLKRSPVAFVRFEEAEVVITDRKVPFKALGKRELFFVRTKESGVNPSGGVPVLTPRNCLGRMRPVLRGLAKGKAENAQKDAMVRDEAL